MSNQPGPGSTSSTIPTNTSTNPATETQTLRRNVTLRVYEPGFGSGYVRCGCQERLIGSEGAFSRRARKVKGIATAWMTAAITYEVE